MTPYVLIQPGALWIGAHYSSDSRRWCIQIVPMLTLCLVLKGGILPRKVRERLGINDEKQESIVDIVEAQKKQIFLLESRQRKLNCQYCLRKEDGQMAQ